MAGNIMDLALARDGVEPELVFITHYPSSIPVWRVVAVMANGTITKAGQLGWFDNHLSWNGLAARQFGASPALVGPSA